MQVPEILYSDNHLLAVNKPAGWLTQASEQTDTRINLEDWARDVVRVEKQKTGQVFLHALHRLDRVVSGVVLLARTSKALERLQDAIRQQRWHKWYRAVVDHQPQPLSGSLRHFLRHDSHCAAVVSQHTPGAKEARLDYAWLTSAGPFHLLEICLHTGRYHQIRAQLAAAGMPILGDLRYGSTTPSWQPDTIALHHGCLELEHPITRAILRIEAPIPPYWPMFQEIF